MYSWPFDGGKIPTIRLASSRSTDLGSCLICVAISVFLQGAFYQSDKHLDCGLYLYRYCR
jgi:hypothetical protein